MPSLVVGCLDEQGLSGAFDTLTMAAAVTDDPAGPAQPSDSPLEIGEDDEGSLIVSGRLLVKFRNVSEQQKRQAVASCGGSIKDEIPRIGVKIIELPEQASETAHLRAFRQRADVEFAELDAVVAPAAIPNDPYYANQWHLPQIAAPDAWDATTGSSDVVIAILDTGCDPTHPDLVAKYVPGWNFYDDNDDTSDVYGHGTPVAGAAAACSDNSIGVASPAWGCRIMPIRTADANGGYISMIASGLTWAADHGARVANVSYVVTGSPTVSSAAQYFQAQGGVVTVSAGNFGIFVSTPDDPYLLTVSATDDNDDICSWSTTGNCIDLAAPGLNIRTTTLDGGYGAGSGTSFSAPVVAGVAALVISVNPELSGLQVQEVLQQSADDLGPTGWDPDYGWGRVNAAQAVALSLDEPEGDTTPPTVSFLVPVDGDPVSGNTSVDTDAWDNVGVSSVTLYADGLLVGTDEASPYRFNWDTTAVPDGLHMLEALAEDAAGNSASVVVSVDVSNLRDTEPPTVIITDPPDGFQVGRSLSVTAGAADNYGVTRVELYVDGEPVATDRRALYSFKVSTRRWSNGSHSLECRAYDAAENVGYSAVVTVYK